MTAHRNLTLWTDEEDRILMNCRPRLTFEKIAKVYLTKRTASACVKRYELLIERKQAPPRTTLASSREIAPEASAYSSEEYGSRQLYHAMLRYALKHGHLLSLSMAQVRARAKIEGVA